MIFNALALLREQHLSWVNKQGAASREDPQADDPFQSEASVSGQPSDPAGGAASSLGENVQKSDPSSAVASSLAMLEELKAVSDELQMTTEAKRLPQNAIVEATIEFHEEAKAIQQDQLKQSVDRVASNMASKASADGMSVVVRKQLEQSAEQARLREEEQARLQAEEAARIQAAEEAHRQLEQSANAIAAQIASTSLRQGVSDVVGQAIQPGQVITHVLSDERSWLGKLADKLATTLCTDDVKYTADDIRPHLLALLQEIQDDAGVKKDYGFLACQFTSTLATYQDAMLSEFYDVKPSDVRPPVADMRRLFRCIRGKIDSEESKIRMDKIAAATADALGGTQDDPVCDAVMRQTGASLDTAQAFLYKFVVYPETGAPHLTDAFLQSKDWQSFREDAKFDDTHYADHFKNACERLMGPKRVRWVPGQATREYYQQGDPLLKRYPMIFEALKQLRCSDPSASVERAASLRL